MNPLPLLVWQRIIHGCIHKIDHAPSVAATSTTQGLDSAPVSENENTVPHTLLPRHQPLDEFFCLPTAPTSLRILSPLLFPPSNAGGHAAEVHLHPSLSPVSPTPCYRKRESVLLCTGRMASALRACIERVCVCAPRVAVLPFILRTCTYAYT
jgi:hypothetical protein